MPCGIQNRPIIAPNIFEVNKKLKSVASASYNNDIYLSPCVISVHRELNIYHTITINPILDSFFGIDERFFSVLGFLMCYPRCLIMVDTIHTAKSMYTPKIGVSLSLYLSPFLSFSHTYTHTSKLFELFQLYVPSLTRDT